MVHFILLTACLQTNLTIKALEKCYSRKNYNFNSLKITKTLLIDGFNLGASQQCFINSLNIMRRLN